MKTCNLLPSRIQRQQLLACRMRQWLAVTAACVLLMLVWFALAWQKRAGEQRDADELNRQSLFVTYLSDQVDTLRKQNRTLGYREALFTNLGEHLQPLSVLGVVGQSAALCPGVVIDRLESTDKPGNSTSPTANKNPAGGSVSIRVEAASSLPVAKFVLALRECHAFRKVELKSGGNQPSSGSTSASFVIECWY